MNDDPVIVEWGASPNDETKRLLEKAIGPGDVDAAVEQYVTGFLSLAVAIRGGRLVGVLGFENSDGRTVIKHIATQTRQRHEGVGRMLVQELITRFPDYPVVAETDCDSVGFYRALGFDVRSLGEKYPGVERFDVIAMPRNGTLARRRVAAYVVRGGNEVLVLTHRDYPEAGVQVPVGGVEEDEREDEAVFREVAEETGLTTFASISYVGTQYRPHPITTQPRRTAFFSVETTDPRDAWVHTVESNDPDGGLVFDCVFMPISAARAALADGQGEFLR